ncbi:MAG: radical SAM protein [bacterium]|nr:radical SAM protein [bacterium]
MPRRLIKSPDVIVVPRVGTESLTLHDRLRGWTDELDQDERKTWEAWGDGSRTDATVERWLAKGFAQWSEVPDSPTPQGFDSRVPVIVTPWARWYAESTDLHVLLNTRAMSGLNPLLVLGPYGSLCWRLAIEGATIGRIRRDTWRIFGRDEAAAFLSRLQSLGFIHPVAGLEEAGEVESPLIKEFPAPDVQFKLPYCSVPWYCLWEVNLSCNLRCKICYLPDFSDPGLEPESCLQLARNIVESGILFVSIFGGEPLLRKDLEQIVRLLRAAGVFVKVITNGLFLSEERARSLADAGLNQIEISFDGLEAATHERSRGAGTFEIALGAVRNARGAIPRVGIVWTVHSGNFHELARLPEFLTSLQIRECYISSFKKTGLNGSSAPFDPLRPHETDRVRAQLLRWKQEHPQLSMALIDECTCGRSSIVIGSNGDLRLCSFAYHSVGNLKQDSLARAWGRLAESVTPAGPLGFCSPPLER